MVERNGTTQPGNLRIEASTKADVRCILHPVCAHSVLNSIRRELERRPRQTLLVHTAYTEREESECGMQGYSWRPLLTRLESSAETIPPKVNGGSEEFFRTGHGNSYFIFFTISENRGKGGRTLTATVRIMMSTYPMDNPLFSLQPATIGLLLSDDKGYGIQDKLSWGYRYGTAASLQGIKWEDTKPPPIFDPLLGQIEAAVNDDP